MANRGGSGPGLKLWHDYKLCEEIERQIRQKRSPDVISNDILKRHQELKVSLCTRTLYNYLERNIFLRAGYQDLVYDHYRKKSGIPVNQPSYRNLRERSIEEWSASANTRSGKLNALNSG